jgi:hypothetical protein
MTKKISGDNKFRIVEVVGVLLAGLVAVHLISSVNQADLQVFIRAGKSVVDGHSPYPKLGTAAVYSGSSFVYPYLVAVAFVPLSLLGTYWGPFVFEIISIMALAYATYTFSSLLRSRESNAVATQISIFATVLLASPTLISLQMGTLTPVILGMLALTWRYRSSAAVSSLLVVGLAFTKVYLVVLGLFFILTRRLRAMAGTFLLALVGLVLNFALSPLGPIGYFRLLTQLAKHESRQGFSFINALHSVYLGKTGAYVILAIGIMTVLALWLRSSNLIKRDDLAFVIAIASTLMATPILWSSYLPVLFVPLLLFADSFVLVAALSYATSVMVTPDRAGTLMIALQFLSVTLLVVPRYVAQIRNITIRRFLVEIDLSKALLVGLLSLGFVIEVLAPALGIQILMVVISVSLILRSRETPLGSQEAIGGSL